MDRININQYAPLNQGKNKVYRSSENHCIHIGNNPSGSYIRQFRVDGDVFSKDSPVQRCDYLLLNDTHLKAYYIELKGSNISKAIDQIENSIALIHSAISEYEVFCRIIYHTGRTHMVKSPKVLKWHKRRPGNKAIISERQYEETV